MSTTVSVEGGGDGVGGGLGEGDVAQAFEPGQAARSLQIFSLHAIVTSAGPAVSPLESSPLETSPLETSESPQIAQATALSANVTKLPTDWKQAADTPAVAGEVSPSQAARASHAVGCGLGEGGGGDGDGGLGGGGLGEGGGGDGGDGGRLGEGHAAQGEELAEP